MAPMVNLGYNTPILNQIVDRGATGIAHGLSNRTGGTVTMDHSTIPQDVPLKFCFKCLEWKPATTEYFHRNKTTRDGFDCQCKDCSNEHSREWRAKNPDYMRQWNVANPNYMRRYRQETSEQQNERSRKLYAENEDVRRRHAERGRAWTSANRARSNANSRNYKARKRNAVGSHNTDDIQRQYKAQKGKCYYCHKKVGKKYHVDHVVPLARGGSNGPENIVIACPHCNDSKQDRLPHEWPKGGRLL